MFDFTKKLDVDSWFRNVTSSLRLVKGKLRLSKWNRVKNSCFQCGGNIPKGRHYICSVGCQNEYSKRNEK